MAHRCTPDGRELAELLEDNPPIDRTSLTVSESADFVAAVRHRTAAART